VTVTSSRRSNPRSARRTLLTWRRVQEALSLLGREATPPTVEAILSLIVEAAGPQHRLDAAVMDTGAVLHRRTSSGCWRTPGWTGTC